MDKYSAEIILINNPRMLKISAHRPGENKMETGLEGT